MVSPVIISFWEIKEFLVQDPDWLFVKLISEDLEKKN
jgi:hypothetical protein